MTALSDHRLRTLLAQGHDAVVIAARCQVSWQVAVGRIAALTPDSAPPAPIQDHAPMPAPEPEPEPEPVPEAPAPRARPGGLRFDRRREAPPVPEDDRAAALAEFRQTGGQVVKCPPGHAAGLTALEGQFGVAPAPRPDGTSWGHRK